MAKGKGPHTANRDAVTGQWVTPGFAKRHPKATVKETVKNPKKK